MRAKLIVRTSLSDPSREDLEAGAGKTQFCDHNFLRS